MPYFAYLIDFDKSHKWHFLFKLQKNKAYQE